MTHRRGDRRERANGFSCLGLPNAAFMILMLAGSPLRAAPLDADVIAKAAGTSATVAEEGVVRIGWSRTDVAVVVDNVPLPPAAGLGSWAAFAPLHDGAMVMGDTVVFEDEVDAAMDAAFSNGLEVTALHNHFFFDEPHAYFMHIGGTGTPQELAAGVKAVWDAIKAVRKRSPQPAHGFGGAPAQPGKLDAPAISRIVGHPAAQTQGVVKVTLGRSGVMHDAQVGASMGLTTWAAFNGSPARASIDGDFIMAAEEVQPVLRALRRSGLHIVALHQHMIGESPALYFTHFWGTGGASALARAFRSALDAQAAVSTH